MCALVTGVQTCALPISPAHYPETINQQFGIPLRLNSDFNERSVRSTVGETYQQIIDDFRASAGVLPVTPTVKSRPSKPAAYGSLPKNYWIMQDSEKPGWSERSEEICVGQEWVRESV